MTTPYTTHDAVKVKLGISLDADVPLDAYLDGLILSVSALFDTTVWGPSAFTSEIEGQGRGGFVWEIDASEFHDGGSNAITLDRLVVDGSSAERGSILAWEDSVLLTQDEDFMIDKYPSRTLYRLSAFKVTDSEKKFAAVFAPGYRNILVQYRPAYEVAPDDVVRACDEETARAFKAGNSQSTDGGFIGITGRTPDAGTAMNYTLDDLTPTTMRMLDGYRKRLSFF
jgi:hypothetical protein